MSKPEALWRQADELAEKALRLRQEANALDRASRRLSAMAAAIADGRESDIAQIAKEIGRA